ncbi:MAG: hypothetical protein ACR2RB_00195 [Gammaproteobacteria bacterium]
MTSGNALRHAVVLGAACVAVLVSIWMTRALLSRDLPALQPWHRPALESEFRARHYREGITFSEYRRLETALMAEVRTRISDKLQPDQQLITNRYFANNPAHANAWPLNWNMSY